MNDHIDRVTRAVGWLEENLTREIRLDDVAAVACLSPFHFERVFCALTGESVFSYVRKRRLSVAFDALLGSDRPVVDIALECRYDSAAAFTRAFSAQFRIAPSRLRKRGRKSLFGYCPGMDADRLAHRLAGGVTLDARVVSRGEIRLFGLSCENTASSNGIPRLWNRFLRAARAVPALLERGTYGVYVYDFATRKEDVTGDMAFTYLAAGERAAGGIADGEMSGELAGGADGANARDGFCEPGANRATKALAGFSAYSIPAGDWAVFLHRGKLMELGKTYEYIFGVWFPKSGRESAPAAHFEYHGPDFRGDFPDSVTEVWIPLA